MKTELKRIRDLIRTDLITMQGGKNNVTALAVTILLIFGGGGFFVSPLFGVMIPPLIAGFLPTVIFTNEVKYRSTKLWALLPVSRRDLVRSRFTLLLGAFLVSSGVFYALMRLSLALRLYRETQEFEILEKMAEVTGRSAVWVLNMWFLVCFVIGLYAAANGLHSYFKDTQAFGRMMGVKTDGAKTQKSLKQTIVSNAGAVFFLAVWLLAMGAMIGMIPVGSVVLLAADLIVSVAQVADGRLLGIVLLAAGILEVIYQYAASVMDYEDREL